MCEVRLAIVASSDWIGNLFFAICVLANARSPKIKYFSFTSSEFSNMSVSTEAAGLRTGRMQAGELCQSSHSYQNMSPRYSTTLKHIIL